MDYKKNFLKTFVAISLILTFGTSLVMPSFVFAIEITGEEGFNEPISGGGGIGDIFGGLGSLLGLVSGGNFVPIAKVQDRPGTLKDMANDMAWSVAKLMVHRITQDIVNLIRTGGQGGAPLFVQDWKGFLLDAADQASGVFLKELNFTQLCEPFGPRLRLIFASGRRSMQERFRCTVSAVAGNLQSFFTDFNNGGWQRWIELTQTQSNPYVSFLGLAAEKEKREAIAVQAKLNEAVSANGFLGIEDCSQAGPTKETDVGDQPIGNVCPIVTPGKYLENRLAKATNSDIEQLNLADSFNEILIAAFQSMINGLFFAPGGLSSSNIYSTTITNQLQQDLDNLKRSGIQLSGIDSAINITQSIIDKKEDSLAKIKDEIIVLGKLKTCKQDKSEPISDVNNKIQTATTTKAALEGNIIDQTIFIELLKDDRADLLLAQTIEQFNLMLQKIATDVAKTKSLAEAVSENEQIAADKSQAEEDLQNCLNPPGNVIE
ncbi:hypothetical protein A3G55_04505 [Candidatus Giovannonibacteria bacterium RIFCSPLOWO2_12_FULL_44_25]|uniref:Uncharacterized protein n=2 Tax=Candidatus Giovannoniibacteriota TaxID=1752738 RepID=A0A1F5WA67_9BACT|nr:MAG: hypothetical protein A2120_05015 [Candidatus Giovannonibacteria bacterium GWA2_45_15]OGF59710.1 MAG: hypothetical protein A2W40_01330 [Candidatus Giovannonibacteria bacterium RIFCSPHIGHO2_01_45_12]OGF60455.1 MAG: hypothetical protein A2656_03365 [Candidatus Giovannonibacteria bacterium RIFCSPHIGHO2_01_FULL_44_100]OGF72547.1 MAG: hypothetical protein A3C05_02540 [Candidatus Giovannonibacteria bacterium RIFCSPHIGHO2_02_FULL_45_40]OGF83388.1 MAG: hypothetical protein A3E63_02715 [Candidatu